MLLRKTIFILLVAIAGFAATAGEPTYSWQQCAGSAMPYPAPGAVVSYPDSLTPVMINHVGRHGARFQASPGHVDAVSRLLDSVAQKGTLTPSGVKLKAVIDTIVTATDGRWGALDRLGAREQQGIARRMVEAYPQLFGRERKVVAVSSYVARCVMSMYEFLHEVATLHQKTELVASSGPDYSPLLRFFDAKAYKNTVKSAPYKDAIDRYYEANITLNPLRRIAGSDYRFGADSIDVALDMYAAVSSMEANGLQSAAALFYSLEEYNALWRCNNFRQYLTRTATNLSSEPADIAAPLLEDLIHTTDQFVAGDTAVSVRLRFGHAETLMPLLSLMQLPGCDYPTADYSEVAANWHNFNVVPMAANLQLILFRSDSGRYYVRIDHNERPVDVPGLGVYVEWAKLRQRLLMEIHQ